MRKGFWPALGALLPLLLVGLGIGWLTGLSVSPVASIIITSAVGAAAAIVGALGGASNEEGQTTTSTFSVNVSAWPLAWLVAGLVIGSSLGVIARTHNFLGQNPSLRIWSNYGLVPNENIAVKRSLENAIVAEIDFWSSNAVGLDKTQVAQRLLDLRYSVPGQSGESKGAQVGGDPGTPGLFLTTTLSRTECETLENQSSTGDLRFEMKRQGGNLRMLSEVLTVDEPELKTLMDAKLEEVVNLLCTPEP